MKTRTRIPSSMGEDSAALTSAGAASIFCIPQAMVRHCSGTVVECAKPLRGNAQKKFILLDGDDPNAIGKSTGISRFIRRAACLARCIV